MFGFEKVQRMRIRRKLEMNGIEYRWGQGQGPMLGVVYSIALLTWPLILQSPFKNKNSLWH
jgi:hypothetical protein